MNRNLEENTFKRFYVIRHCKAAGQEPQSKLISEGIEQSYKLSAFLCKKKIEYIISSSYERAYSSVEPLAQKMNLKIITDARLCERILSSENISNWEEKLYNTFQDFEMRLPGGETSSEALKRGMSVINELLEIPENNIVLVTHGNLLCLILRYFDESYGFDEWKSLTNPDVFELLIPINKDEKIIIKRIWE